MISELKALFEYYEKEKGIDRAKMVEALSQALLAASKKSIGPARELRIDIDPDKGTIKVFAKLIAVETVANHWEELQLETAKRFKINAVLGDEIEVEVTPNNMGRIAAQTAKQTMLQRLRMAEKENLYEEFKDRTGDVVSGVVRRFETSDVIVDLGKFEGVMTSKERVSTEDYTPGDRMRFYVKAVEKDSGRSPEIILSRAHSNFVRRLFEFEVSEIGDRTVEIASIAREAGNRSKMAVHVHSGCGKVNLVNSLLVNNVNVLIGLGFSARKDICLKAKNSCVNRLGDIAANILDSVSLAYSYSNESLMRLESGRLRSLHLAPPQLFLPLSPDLSWKRLAEWMICDAMGVPEETLDRAIEIVLNPSVDSEAKSIPQFICVVKQLSEDSNFASLSISHLELLKAACAIARKCRSPYAFDQSTALREVMVHQINGFIESSNRWLSLKRLNRTAPSIHHIDRVSACLLPLRLSLYTASDAEKYCAVLIKMAAAEDTSCHLARADGRCGDEIALLDVSPVSTSLEWSFASCMHEALHICFTHAVEEQNMKWINDMSAVPRERLEETSVHALTHFACGMSRIESLVYCKLVAQHFAGSFRARSESLPGFIVSFSELTLRLHVAREFADVNLSKREETDDLNSFGSFHCMLWNACEEFLPEHLIGAISQKGKEVVRLAAQEHALERCDELSSSIDRRVISKLIWWLVDYLPELALDRKSDANCILRARCEVRSLHKIIQRVSMLRQTQRDQWERHAIASLFPLYPAEDADEHRDGKRKLLLVACLLGGVLSAAKHSSQPDVRGNADQFYWDMLKLVENVHNQHELGKYASRYWKKCGVVGGCCRETYRLT